MTKEPPIPSSLVDMAEVLDRIDLGDQQKLIAIGSLIRQAAARQHPSPDRAMVERVAAAITFVDGVEQYDNYNNSYVERSFFKLKTADQEIKSREAKAAIAAMGDTSTRKDEDSSRLSDYEIYNGQRALDEDDIKRSEISMTDESEVLRQIIHGMVGHYFDGANGRVTMAKDVLARIRPYLRTEEPMIKESQYLELLEQFRDVCLKLGETKPTKPVPHADDPNPSVWNWKNTNDGARWGTPRIPVLVMVGRKKMRELMQCFGSGDGYSGFSITEQELFEELLPHIGVKTYVD